MALNEAPKEYDLAPPVGTKLQPIRPLADLKAEPAKPRAALGLTGLFMALAGGLVIGTILYQPNQEPPRLQLSQNDASRWNTVYYLVTHHTYEFLPDHHTWWQKRKGSDRPRDWWPFSTIDMVATKDAQGKYHYYSSKPPLLATCVAGVVIGIEKVSAAIEPAVRWVYERTSTRPLSPDGDAAKGLPTRVTFQNTPYFIIPATLILVQAIPFLLFVWVIAKQFRESTESAFVRNFCIAVAALGTYLTPWSIGLNNHVLGAFAVLFAAHAGLRVWYDGKREWYWFAVAGLMGGFAVAMELPALAFAAVILVGLIWKDWRRGLLIGLTCAAIPIAADLLTNYLELGTLQLAYADVGKQGGMYDFPGSYWVPMPSTGIDGLHEPKSLYLMNILVGHHGFFLLTPILLVALLGMGRHFRPAGIGVAFLVSLVLLGAVGTVIADAIQQGRIAERVDEALAPLLRGREYHVPRGYLLLVPLGLLVLMNLGMYLPAPSKPRPMLALMVLVISAVVIGFYTVMTNNYGGWAQGARWLFWLIPFWLLLLPAGMEWMTVCRRRRAACYVLLGVSMVSVAFALQQPWMHSWVDLIRVHLGWVDYY
jgi:hypothetical protein